MPQQAEKVKGRHSSETLVDCPACSWRGPVRELIHGYKLNSQAEIEPIDQCPCCGHVVS